MTSTDKLLSFLEDMGYMVEDMGYMVVVDKECKECMVVDMVVVDTEDMVEDILEL
jgi:hypothetical protein